MASEARMIVPIGELGPATISVRADGPDEQGAATGGTQGCPYGEIMFGVVALGLLAAGLESRYGSCPTMSGCRRPCSRLRNRGTCGPSPGPAIGTAIRRGE